MDLAEACGRDSGALPQLLKRGLKDLCDQCHEAQEDGHGRIDERFPFLVQMSRASAARDWRPALDEALIHPDASRGAAVWADILGWTGIWHPSEVEWIFVIVVRLLMLERLRCQVGVEVRCYGHDVVDSRVASHKCL